MAGRRLAVCTGLILMSGCGSDRVTTPAATVLVTVTPSSASISVGSTQRFVAIARDAAGRVMTDLPLTWISSAPGVVTIDSTGLAKGVGNGTASITAQASNGVAGRGVLHVLPAPGSEFAVTVFSSRSGTSSRPFQSIQVPPDHKVISCGAQVRATSLPGPGLLITGVYPSDTRTCTAIAKDHLEASQGTLQVWAVGLYDPTNKWDVLINSRVQIGTSATATLPADYALTGGGGRVVYTGAGVMLTTSRPNADNGWNVEAKDHIEPDPSAITTAYVIGVRSRESSAALTSAIFLETSSGIQVVTSVTNGGTLVGCGAQINWNGAGRLLAASYPQGQQCVAAGVDHLRADHGTVTAYAIGLRKP
jgi:hypothetical protein